ncbi:MAG: DUF374 domain-containing protein [Fibrobacter sp.]|uniref:lysophospholipid acyltransferase family protein n=1 Tax=Fibrobacter sp. UWH5 TaxID=1896211 RepID=UPI000910C102|nr:DUF374 domain-containing protein [Fibrobacter sp. UWH5]MCQ2099900.1 DUF374 domain-containing protein [Fibrobacter sp.]MDO4946162.1 DUF374 domain-containing protein [Fibrobacter sp.]SHK92669.1 hypothetical protein SAMN05720764_105155 [Fibrobacter sp. UWH5]
MNKATLKVRAASWLAALWIRSLRIRLRTPADFGPGVLGLWHQDLLASTAAFKDRGVHVLVSQSDDGAFFAETARRLGYKVTRGSDTRGATNVRHLLDSMKQGGFTGMALDGPKGPAHKVKSGSIWLSKVSGTPLWHIQPHYGAHFMLKTWDNFILPLPLSSIDIEIKYLCTENNPTK